MVSVCSVSSEDSKFGLACTAGLRSMLWSRAGDRIRSGLGRGVMCWPVLRELHSGTTFWRPSTSEVTTDLFIIIIFFVSR